MLQKFPKQYDPDVIRTRNLLIRRAVAPRSRMYPCTMNVCQLWTNVEYECKRSLYKLI